MGHPVKQNGPASGQDPFLITQESFDAFRTKLREVTGIALSEGKVELVRSRLRNYMTRTGTRSLADFNRYLFKLSPADPEWQQLINAMTTNKTNFFREPEHFDFLINQYLPDWHQKHRKKELRFWSAACSTGEEPYTLALTLEAHSRAMGIPYRILATDIDTEVLANAQRGVYRRKLLDEVPELYRNCFVPGTAEIKDWMKVKKEIRASIDFRLVNLIETPYQFGEAFNVIFCRNVMIYFTPETIEKVATHMFKVAAPGALLFIGHSESLQNVQTPWQYLQPSIYRKPER